MSAEGIESEVVRYFMKLERRYRDDEVFKNRDLAELITSREYLATFTRQQMEGILGLEYMKHVLGKNPIIPVASLLSVRAERQGRPRTAFLEVRDFGRR